MATYHVGVQSDPKIYDFLPLTVPTYLPSLVSPHGEDSPHLPVAHHTQAIELQGFSNVRPITQPSSTGFGTTDRFEFKRNDTTDVLTACILCVELKGLIPDGGNGGVNARYHDDVLCAAIDRIEFMYGDQVCQTLYGDQIHFMEEQELPEDEFQRRQRMRASGLSKQDRVTKAAANQWVYLEIPFWWTRSPAMNFHVYAFQRQVSVNIVWRSLGYFVQQDISNNLPTALGGGSAFFDNKYLRFLTAVPTEATKQVYRKLVESQGIQGWLDLIMDTYYSTDNILPANGGVNARETQLKLDINKYIYNMKFVIRQRNSIVDGVITANDRWNLYSLKEYRFLINNQEFFPNIDDFWAKNWINGKFFLGNSQLPVYNVMFTTHPDMHSHGMGGLEFSNANDPRLCVTIGPENNLDLMVDIWGEYHNYVSKVLQDNKSAMERVVK